MPHEIDLRKNYGDIIDKVGQTYLQPSCRYNLNFIGI